MKRFFAFLLNVLLVVMIAVVCGLAAYYAASHWLQLWPQAAISAACGVGLSVAAVSAVFLFLRQGGDR